MGRITCKKVRKTVIQLYKQGKYCKKMVETLSFSKRTQAKMIQIFKRKGHATALSWQPGVKEKSLHIKQASWSGRFRINSEKAQNKSAASP